MTFREWLESTRLGLDFGPKGVGVGVVRRTSVLFAQSFLNLGSSDLEGRRGHRRSRRTHRMRQRRLRRFRQYCLTHNLPDPVPLAHTSTTPHPLLDQSQIPDPRWHDIKEVRDRLLTGKGSPEDFARFCYDLCRRRGFTYDSLDETVRRALRPKRGKMPTPSEVEKALAEEFQNAQISSAFAESIRNIFRESGYEKLIMPESKLAQDLREAIERRSDMRQARSKRPREAVWKELEEVGRANPQFAAHQAEIRQIIDWRPRSVRSDNRASTMWRCSWCDDRWRPRLVNLAKDKDPLVRDGLLWEAIHNLRHRAEREKASKVRPWWTTRFAKEYKTKGRVPSDDTRQAVFSELKTVPTSADRPELMKKISEVFKKYRLAHSEKQKFADLLRPREKDEGRSKRCRECIKLGAQAKSSEDYRRIRQMVLDRRRESNKKTGMEAWLDRCIKAIRQALLYTDPKGKVRCRYGAVRTVSLEVPRYDPGAGQSPMQRLEQAKKRREYPFLRQRHLEQSGRCIYCGMKPFDLREEPRGDGTVRYSLSSGFEEEHIFPRSDRYHGQDLQINKVISCVVCQAEKGNQTPRHWLKDPEKWVAFEQRVRQSLLPQATKELLLSKEDQYPDLVELLARSAQIRKSLTEKLKNLFKEVEITLSDQDIIFVDGATTQLARRSWNSIKDQQGNRVENFPIKDRDHPAHHAQDAVLAASIPPHYLRRAGEWLIPQGDKRMLGTPDRRYAPNWPVYTSKTKRRPLSIDLTRRRSDWHTQQWDDSIYGRDSEGRFFIRKEIAKVRADMLPEDSTWVKDQLTKGKAEIVDRGGNKVRRLKVYPVDVGPTNMREERPNSGRWRKLLSPTPWVLFSQSNGVCTATLADSKARLKPAVTGSEWAVALGDIVWVKKEILRSHKETAGGQVTEKEHVWRPGWYRVTKINRDRKTVGFKSLSLEPCDQALPFKDAEISVTAGQVPEKLRWPQLPKPLQ